MSGIYKPGWQSREYRQLSRTQRTAISSEVDRLFREQTGVARRLDPTYFDPSDADYPISWNLLQAEHPERKHLVASGIVAAFKSMWRDSWGPRLEYILYASMATLMECENASLIGISRLLADPEYRWRALKQVKDPGLLSFWQYEFERYNERFLREAAAIATS